jgi:hypothetical protein
LELLITSIYRLRGLNLRKGGSFCITRTPTLRAFIHGSYEPCRRVLENSYRYYQPPTVKILPNNAITYDNTPRDIPKNYDQFFITLLSDSIFLLVESDINANDCVISEDNSKLGARINILVRQHHDYYYGITAGEFSKYCKQASNIHYKILSAIKVSFQEIELAELIGGQITTSYKNKTVFIKNISATASASLTKIIESIDTNKISQILSSDLLPFLDGNLLAQSLSIGAKTPSMQFLSIWIALEKFIKMFYKSLSEHDRQKEEFNNSDILKKYPAHNNHDMPLLNKYIVIRSKLGLPVDDASIRSFQRIKSVRNNIHNDIKEFDSFPNYEVNRILRELFSTAYKTHRNT